MASLQTQTSGKKGNFIGTQGGAESFGSESFAALFEESLNRQEMKQGEVITAEVIRVDYNFVVVNAGLKSEAYIPLEEFKSDSGELDVKRDFVSVASSLARTATATPFLSRDQSEGCRGLNLEKSAGFGELVAGTITQGQGRPDGDDQGSRIIAGRGRYASVKDTTPLEGKTLTSRSSSLIASATTSSYRAAQWSKPAWVRNAPSCWAT